MLIIQVSKSWHLYKGIKKHITVVHCCSSRCDFSLC